MRIAALAVVSALISVLAACNPSAPSGGGGGLFPDLNGASYRAEATAYTDDGQSIPIVQIRSGNKMRMEFNAEQGQMAVVNNGEGGESFALVTRNGSTTAMRGMQDAFDSPADQWGGDFATTATRTGTCSVAGETGAEWTRTNEQNQQIVACVTQDGIILRSTENGQVRWETTSVQRGPQDASLFVVPEGVQVMDVGAIMEQAGAATAGMTPQICNALRNAGAPPERLAQAGC